MPTSVHPSPGIPAGLFKSPAQDTQPTLDPKRTSSP